MLLSCTFSINYPGGVSVSFFFNNSGWIFILKNPPKNLTPAILNKFFKQTKNVKLSSLLAQGRVE